MSYTKDEKDWLGRDKKGHYDENGNKIGTSKQEKDWLGNERTASFDSQGNKIGISKEEKDWLGNEKTVHYDADGNKSGSSKSEKDWKGDDIIQHYDQKGNKTGQSKYEKDWLGRRVLKHSKTSNSGNTAIGYLILLAIVVIVVFGTFSFPYKFIDQEITPFKLNWLKNKNVWFFCTSFWTLLITLIFIIKLANKEKNGQQPIEFIASKGLLLVMPFLVSVAIVVTYVIKAKLPDQFILLASILVSVLAIIVALTTWKTTKAIHLISTFVISAGMSVYFLNTESYLNSYNFSQSEIVENKEVLQKVENKKTETVIDTILENPNQILLDISKNIFESIQNGENKIIPNYMSDNEIKLFYWQSSKENILNGEYRYFQDKIIIDEYSNQENTYKILDFLDFKNWDIRNMEFYGIGVLPASGFGGGTVFSVEKDDYVVRITKSSPELADPELWFIFTKLNNTFKLKEIGTWAWTP